MIKFPTVNLPLNSSQKVEKNAKGVGIVVFWNILVGFQTMLDIHNLNITLTIRKHWVTVPNREYIFY